MLHQKMQKILSHDGLQLLPDLAGDIGVAMSGHGVFKDKRTLANFLSSLARLPVGRQGNEKEF